MERRFSHGFLICALVAAIYAGTLGNSFNIDTPNLLLDNQAVHGLSLPNLKAVFTSVPNSVEYLPVRDLTYMVDYSLWGLEPAGYHAANVLYYGAGCLLFYLFLLRLARDWTGNPGGFALVAALLFAAHPVHVEAAAGVAQRKDLLLGLFSFLSLWALLRCRDGKGLSWYLLSVAAFALAMLSKATAVALPVIVLLLNLFVLEEGRKGVWKAAPFFVVGGALAFVNVRIAADTGILASAAPADLLVRLLNVPRVLLTYLRMLLVPWPLTAWHEFSFLDKAWAPAVAFSWVFVVLLGVAWWRLRTRAPVYAFSILWFVVLAGPTTGILPASTVIAERYLFLPVAGFAMALAWWLTETLAGRRRVAAQVAAGLMIVVSSGLSHARTRDWKTNETLLLSGIRHAPDSVRLNRMLGRYYFVNRRYDPAMSYLRKVKELEPGDLDLEFHTALRLFMEGGYAQGIATLDAVGLRNADVVDVQYLYGMLWEGMGNRQAAEVHLLRAERSSRIAGVFFKRDVRNALARLRAAGQGGRE